MVVVKLTDNTLTGNEAMGRINNFENVSMGRVDLVEISPKTFIFPEMTKIDTTFLTVQGSIKRK